mmetsp:Transcript_41566/g.99631  ORF Transcript_41566/g.99631 Transcript_41566/m.99631 type:complete len:543 (+) Transcript_41566:182-1810(+)
MRHITQMDLERSMTNCTTATIALLFLSVQLVLMLVPNAEAFLQPAPYYRHQTNRKAAAAAKPVQMIPSSSSSSPGVGVMSSLRIRPSQSSSSLSPSSTQLGVTTLDKWKMMPNGSVIGTVRGHPSIEDGDVITTSPISNPEAASRLSIVVTSSGSRYKLLEPREGSRNSAPPPAPAAAPAPSSSQSSSSSSSSPSFFGRSRSVDETVNEASSSLSSSSIASREDDPDVIKRQIRQGPEWKKAVMQYKLTGATVGLEDEYLLAGKPERSTSGKSNIWEAYRANNLGLPQSSTPVCAKISTNIEAISREYENYKKLSFLGFATGRFVRCYEFFPVAGYEKRFRNQCALVIERGQQDLKSFLNSRGRLEGKELRDACIAATQCVQALHGAGLVWTDMKTENFVVMPNGEVKGIDLESAIPVGENPVDYSPEACPPEFATAFLAGDGPYFELENSYDIWSLGMLMLELATGRGYFDGKNPSQITKILRDMETGPMDLEGIEMNERLKDLISKCLQKDPSKRPNTAQILLHPYFLAAGGPFSFSFVQ